MAEIKYEIVESLGVISESNKGWTKELNLVAWNNYAPKYDIREWDPEHEKMGKGLTFTKDEIVELKNLIDKLDLE